MRPNAWPIGSRRTGATAISESAATVCPGCGALLPADQLDCPACSAPPSPSQARSALLRLIPLTRRRAWAIVLGFLLTVASTAASLVPPYLTQPLVDDVLIPRQASGADVPFHLVWWYLGLMLAASLVAWLLAWARSYVMAWVSERIAADLRNRTYPHLQRPLARVLRRQAHRRPDVADRLATPTGSATSCRSTWSTSPPTADDRRHGGHPAVDGPAPGRRDPGPASPGHPGSSRSSAGHLRHGFDAGNRAWAR